MKVEIRDLWKRYPGTWALRDISLRAETGRVLGILGENGCGKSTLFRILAGVTRPSKGTVLLDGQPVGVETRRRVAFLPEVNPFYKWMGVVEQLEFLSAFYPGWDMDKSRELLKFMNLPEDQKIGTLSRGQQGRLKVVAAFSWSSDLVLMDDPFAGIDPPSRRRILQGLFNEFRFDAQTMFLTSHLVTEIEAFIEDLVFMKAGEIALSGNMDQVREEQGKSLEEIFETVAY